MGFVGVNIVSTIGYAMGAGQQKAGRVDADRCAGFLLGKHECGRGSIWSASLEIAGYGDHMLLD
jgi:hypothetical protein